MIYAVLGPTATGKTSLALELCRVLNGEIISCDSMQIYKNLSIGTAKPSLEELCGINYHLIDYVDLDQYYSASDYAADAKYKIKDIYSRLKTPIFCGGTGLYFDSVFNYSFPSHSTNNLEIRDKLIQRDQSVNFDELKKIDPESFERIDKNNYKRIIRSLEIYYSTGVSKTDYDYASRCGSFDENVKIILLTSDNREYLYDKINKRVDSMIQLGLIQEAEFLYSYDSCKTVKQAIGYKELFDYFSGNCTLDESVELIKKNSRNYAKRQITWFKKYKNAFIVDIFEYKNTKDIVNLLLNNDII